MNMCWGAQCCAMCADESEYPPMPFNHEAFDSRLIYLSIKTYLYRVVHNQIIIILFYSVALLLANGKSSDNNYLKIKHYLRHDMCSQSFLKRM